MELCGLESFKIQKKSHYLTASNIKVRFSALMHLNISDSVCSGSHTDKALLLSLNTFQKAKLARRTKSCSAY